MKCESEPSWKDWWIKRCLWKHESGAQVTFTAVKGNMSDHSKGERQIHRDIIHAGVRRPEVGEPLANIIPCMTLKPNTSPVKHVPWAAPQLPVQNHSTSPGECFQTRSQVRTHSLVSTSTKQHLEPVRTSALLMWKCRSIRSNKRGMGRITETHKHVWGDESDRTQQDKPLKMSSGFMLSLKLSLQIWVSLRHT